MRFINVLFLATWQLTAIPFVALLTANTGESSKPVVAISNHNNTVVYKTVAALPGMSPLYD